MKIDHEKYINLLKQHIGDEIREILPQFHAITGCDSTSFMFSVGKIKALKQIINNSELIHSIREIGDKATVSAERLEDAKKSMVCPNSLFNSRKKAENISKTEGKRRKMHML